MLDLLKHKFDQNPDLKQKLAEKKGFFYEMTQNQTWGTGLPYTKANLINQGFPGKNLQGKLLVKLRDGWLAQG